MLSHIFATCLLLAAETYNVPPAVLVGIHKVEGGKVGQAVGPNKNGSFDLGPMQINTIWIPELSDMWGVGKKEAYLRVRDDPCTNVEVAAWILRSHLDETGSLSRSIAHYHSRTKRFGYPYRRKVIKAMQRAGLMSAQ